MNASARLRTAWLEAGYPPDGMPKKQFEQVAVHVSTAFHAGEEDFLRMGWAAAKVDFPFASAHPRYAAMQEAYRRLTSTLPTPPVTPSSAPE